jgi:hypothetical protein
MILAIIIKRHRYVADDDIDLAGGIGRYRISALGGRAIPHRDQSGGATS